MEAAASTSAKQHASPLLFDFVLEGSLEEQSGVVDGEGDDDLHRLGKSTIKPPSLAAALQLSFIVVSAEKKFIVSNSCRRE